MIRQRKVNLSLLMMAFALLAPSAVAQCEGQWLQHYTLGAMRVSDNPWIPAVCTLPNGDIVVAGQFNTTTNPPAHGIARWNGTAWGPLGAGLPSGTSAQSLAVLPNGDLVAGLYTDLGGPLQYNVMRWDGSTWSPLGAGAGGGGRVWALVVAPNGDLLAAAGTGTQVARWDGSSWSNVGGRFDQEVFALAVMPNGDIIAGGRFIGIYGNGLNLWGIGRWNGTNWVQMGAGFPNGAVTALAVLPNGNVVASGSFSVSAVHGPAVGVALWTGGPWWHAMGTGLSPGGTGWALAVLPNGDPVVAGDITMAGGVPVDGVARWDGTNWSSVGRGLVRYSAQALKALPGGDLLLTGYSYNAQPVTRWALPTANFNHDGVVGDADIAAFFACLAGRCCPTCSSADLDGDGEYGTDSDIEAFFRMLAGGSC